MEFKLNCDNQGLSLLVVKSNLITNLGEIFAQGDSNPWMKIGGRLHRMCLRVLKVVSVSVEHKLRGSQLLSDLKGSSPHVQQAVHAH